MDLVALIEEREEAREKKDYDKADTIRYRLRSSGAQINVAVNS